MINVYTWTLALHDIPNYDETVNGKKRTRVDCDALSEIIARYRVGLMSTEKVHAMPLMDVKGIFSFGRAYGQLEMLCACHGIPRFESDPAVWKRKMQIDSDKDFSRERARQLIPALAPYLSRKTDHDRAEAALLGLFAIFNLGMMPGNITIEESTSAKIGKAKRAA